MPLQELSWCNALANTAIFWSYETAAQASQKKAGVQTASPAVEEEAMRRGSIESIGIDYI